MLVYVHLREGVLSKVLLSISFRSGRGEGTDSCCPDLPSCWGSL